MATLSVALTGNPNTGKTTIFNALTGTRQKIGNWPGVTVDKKVGYVKYNNRVFSVIDLPGTYSINAYSQEEKIVMEYLTDEQPDIVLNVVDASNLERNLYLTIQLLENNIPVIVDLNMMDEAKTRGLKIQTKELERQLGMPVVETVAKDKKSIGRLLEVFSTETMGNYKNSPLIMAHIERVNAIKGGDASSEQMEEIIAQMRYQLIDKILGEVTKVSQPKRDITAKLDRVLAQSFLSVPLLLFAIYAVFEITFEWFGQPMADAIDEFIGESFTPAVAAMMETYGVSEWLHNLIIDGVIAGVGGVVTFVPLIFTLFFCLSFLEGTGYMARVAFIMDPLMRRIGLNGKAIMPLIMGFGCAVPAIMGARALDSARDRKVAILVTPFLTCGAKLPIMALFAAMFFPDDAVNVIFSIYLLGILTTVIMAKILSSTLFKNEDSGFLLELPPYRMPEMRTVLLETWDKGKGFLIKAGTIIFAMSIVIWFASNYNFSGQADMEESFLAILGAGVANLFAWHGFATWEAGAAVITGILAKESVVSTMGILYGVAELSEDAIEAANEVKGTMGMAFTALSAYAFMVFTSLYTPCMTAIGTIKKEMDSYKWTLFAIIYTFAVAWIISLLVYQGGRLFSFE